MLGNYICFGLNACRLANKRFLFTLSLSRNHCLGLTQMKTRVAGILCYTCTSFTEETELFRIVTAINSSKAQSVLQ